ncbi:MAG TPA: outer membrane beta-barrel protein [Bacteroidia bacterium]|nr:outer membrane beta-barrel protein [Bacteroidia bacterium]
MKNVLAWMGLLVFPAAAVAQFPEVRAGGRIASGMTHFTDLAGQNASYTLAWEAGLAACRQFSPYFSFETYPAFVAYGSRAKGAIPVDNENTSGAFYTHEESYRIYSLQFPFVFKFYVPLETMRLHWLAGPDVGLNLSGNSTRRFDNKNVAGYVNRSMNNLENVFFSILIGFGTTFETRNGLIMLDYRVRQGLSPSGYLQHHKFLANASTIGLTWMY